MSTSTTPELRPLNIGQLLDRGIRLYRNNFLTFIGIVAIMQVPVILLQMGVSLLMLNSRVFQFAQNPEAFSPGDFDSPFSMFDSYYFIGVFGSLAVSFLSYFLVQGIATAALTRAIGDSYLGQQTNIANAYGRLGNSWLRLLWALFLMMLISIGLMIWWIVPCIGWITGLGIITFFGMAVSPLVAPIIVLEGQEAGAAIRRAWELTRRRFWWVLGFAAILAIFSWVLVSGPSTVIATIAQFAVGEPPSPLNGQSMTQTVVQSLVTMVASLLYLPLQLTCMTLLYFDLRVRTEGFDLAVLSASMSDPTSDVTEVTASAPTGGTQASLVTNNEMGYFIAVSVGAFALFFALSTILQGVIALITLVFTGMG